MNFIFDFSFSVFDPDLRKTLNQKFLSGFNQLKIINQKLSIQ